MYFAQLHSEVTQHSSKCNVTHLKHYISSLRSLQCPLAVFQARIPSPGRSLVVRTLYSARAVLVVVEPAFVLTMELVGAVATIIMTITHKASVCAFSVGTVDGALE